MAKTELKNDSSNAITISLNGDTGNILAGGHGQGGALFLVDKNDKRNIIALAGVVSDPEEIVFAGGHIFLLGANGSISLHNQEGALSARLNPNLINLMVGGHSRILLDSTDANMYLGGNGMGGDIFLYPAGGNFMGEKTTAPSLQLSGDKGDIVLANADCAEEFDVLDEEAVDPGTVMVMNADGRLAQSLAPYDKKVAGVVAGAGGQRPGIILGRQVTESHRLPIGLVGRVSCKVDADYSAISVGDLLTTSPTPGHAMKATDPSQAFGAVLGKAMAALAAGQGLVPILIALQ